MSLLRGLAVFILSSIFILSVFMAITAYTLAPLIQKDSITAFFRSASLSVVNDQCQKDCSQYTDYKDTCLQTCPTELTNQTETGVDDAVNSIYQQKFFGVTLEQMSALLSQYVLLLVIGIVTAVMLLFVSKNPFSTLGKDFATLAASLFISSFTPQFIIASVNLPFNFGDAIKNYFSAGFNQQFQYAVVFMVSGIILIVIDYLLSRRESKTEKK